LLKFDAGNYRIINRQSGLALLQRADGSLAEDVPSMLADQRDEWQIVQDTAIKLAPPPRPDREAAVTNGTNSNSPIDWPLIFYDRYLHSFQHRHFHGHLVAYIDLPFGFICSGSQPLFDVAADAILDCRANA
jgi:hypothetical protein